MIEFRTYMAVDSKLKKMILAAVGTRFFQPLENPVQGLGHVSAWDLLHHLQTNYNDVTHEELETNEAKLDTTWDPATPLEDLFNLARKVRTFSTTHNAKIPESTAISKLLAVIKKAGTLGEGVKDWVKKPFAQQTLTNMETHFIQANTNETRRNVRQLPALDSALPMRQ